MKKNERLIFTAPYVKSVAADGTRQEIPDGQTQGLYLIVQPSGKKSWAVRYSLNNAVKKFTIGDVDLVTLADARQAAVRVRKEAGEGRDPQGEKIAAAKAEPIAPVAIETVDSVLDDFIKLHVKKKNKAKTAYDVENTIKRELRPVWGSRDIQSIKRRDIVKLLDAMVIDREIPVMANRVHSLLSKFFNWCESRSILEISPMGKLGKPAPESSRDRVLSDDELRWLWTAAEEKAYPFGVIVQGLVLTAQRRTEVGELDWNEIDLDASTWIIPKARAKNGQEHLVPLSAPAVALLKSIPRVTESDFVFTTTEESAVSGYSRAKESLDARIVELAKQEAIERGEDADKIVVPHWTYHDIRRTVATRMGDMGVLPHVVEALLNHISGSKGGVAGVYNLAKYGKEKREALDLWAAYVMRAVASKPGSNVVPFKVA